MEEEEDGMAVIGIGCNFPGGEGLDNFWRVLSEGRNCAADIPAERFDASLWYNAEEGKPGRTQTARAALIEGFNEFDHRFFGIPEVEADFMDPQQKLLLQCTYRALEDAGVAMEDISGSRTGVYIGVMNKDYEMIQNNNAAAITHYNGTGTAMSMAANRVSFTFNLTGPSFAIDSACSSSLVALHLACQAIRQGDCQMALCGGVSCIIEPRVFVALSKARMISPDGTSKPFSSRADGYGRGEGCGVVLLKPLAEAIKDCNKIWGVISKTAVNQDGHSVTPITKPSVVQQQELLERIYSETDIANVQYIEAHGTGTPVGDPVEAESISNAIAKAKPPGSATLRIGTVKGNVGHTESAAGVAGLIKVLLMVKHATIVPSVSYSEDSSSVDVKRLGLSIPTEAERWEAGGSLGRVAGINSFGFGGTNAHAIVREHRQTSIPTQIPKCGSNLFAISAESEKSFVLSMADTHQRLRSDQTIDLQALSYTSACGRSHSRNRYRKAFLASSLDDLQHHLASAVKTKFQAIGSDVRVFFVFCGNGVAYRGMCKQLLRRVPAFRDKIREVENLFQSHKSINIGQWLAAECDSDDFNRPNIVQPLLFAIQVGVAALLKQWGVKPDAVIGHSVGEVAAAQCSGLLSLEDAVKVLHHRSTLQSNVTGGKMLLVGNVAVEKVLEILPDFSGKICVAAFNSPQSCTLSGDSGSIDVLRQRLWIDFPEKNLFLHELDVPTAYHSHMMDPILEDIERSIDPLDANQMESKLFSTVTGDCCSDGDFRTGKYWARNIREPVLFEQALRAAAKDEQPKRKAVFVEIGPRRSLQRSIHETLGNNATVLSSIQPEKDYDTILSTVAKLFELGINVDWHQVYRGCETLPTAFPVYQFVNTRKELNFEAVRNGDESPAFSSHTLISQTRQGNNEFTWTPSLDTAPYLWEHKNNGVPIAPGSFYVELAYASIVAMLKPKKPVSQLQLSIRFESPFTLSASSHQFKVIVDHRENEASFKIQSPVATHTSGTYRCTDGQPLLEEPFICLDMIFQRCKTVMKQREIYSILSQAGFEYGPIFKQIDDVHFGDELKEAVAAIQVPGELLKDLHAYFIHPVLLDNFMQMTAVIAMRQLKAKHGFPSAICSVVISRPLQEKMVMYLRATKETPDFLEVCGSFSTKEGHVLVELKGVRISFLGNCSESMESHFFHNEMFEIPHQSDLQNCQIKAIVFKDQLGIAERLGPYMHPDSTLVKSREHWMTEQIRHVVFQSLSNNMDLDNVLFIWGAEDLSHLSSEKILRRLATCCELFRQIVLALKDSQRSFTVHVITYRATDTIVDHVNPGFVLSGMTRACAAEIPGLSFHLIDLASVTSEDIQMLVHVVNTFEQHEVTISKGQALTANIERTPIRVEGSREEVMQPVDVNNFVLQTTDPYSMAPLSAMASDSNVNVQEKSVEIQLSRICVHSSDYFPVTISNMNFGKTMYWSTHTSQTHKLLSLDFTGIVRTVGKGVSNLRVGDQIASCCPITASARIMIPEAVCYKTETFPFLKENPCVSYFVLAWEILQRKLPEVKRQRRKLIIVSSSSASALLKVLALTANRSGWNVSSLAHLRGQTQLCEQSHALVFLPPFDLSWQGMRDIGGHDRHVVFVCSDLMSSSLPANMFVVKNEGIHIHKLDVANVLQRANLQAQNRKISNWLLSLRFDAASLPLKRETFQLFSTTEPQTNVESYFTTKTVKQVVLHHRESDCPVSDIPLMTRPGLLFKQSCIYIVTGGLSGLGLETVIFIAKNGGGFIATLSRRCLTDEKRCEMEIIKRRYGVKIMNVQCDVSVSVQVVDAISEIEQTFPSCPIKGVFHSAAVLHDALIENLDEPLFRKVLQPKVSGALNLHYATLHSQLDFFVCYSSISSFIGNPSQSNYAAANSFLDTFCHYRRNRGLAGQSVNWGPLNLGLLLNREHFQNFLEAKGMMVMDGCDIHEALERCLLMNRPQQVICKFNFKTLNVHVLSQNASLRERLSALVEMELKDLTNESGVQLSLSPDKSLRNIVSDISNMSVDDLDDDAALWTLGIDSLLAMTLQNKLFQETGVNVPLVRLLDPNSTLATLQTAVNNG
ncbi:mycocerosic acid synthase-like polyketide synthase [Brachionichthys hirsutus]|uniref:mycocerosic acid synthase-like polyketide synthase n=1 Tax=Brachionichthys hirsutus TaxID=412623 RepID=UPI003604ED5E